MKSFARIAELLRARAQLDQELADEFAALAVGAEPVKAKRSRVASRPKPKLDVPITDLSRARALARLRGKGVIG